MATRKEVQAAKAQLEKEQRQKAALEFQATLPRTYLGFLAQANAAGVETVVSGHLESVLTISFKFRQSDAPRNEYDEYRLRLDSEPWEVDVVASEFQRLIDEANERERVRKIALDAYEMLSPEQRSALNVKRPT